MSGSSEQHREEEEDHAQHHRQEGRTISEGGGVGNKGILPHLQKVNKAPIRSHHPLHAQDNGGMGRWLTTKFETAGNSRRNSLANRMKCKCCQDTMQRKTSLDGREERGILNGMEGSSVFSG